MKKITIGIFLLLISTIANASVVDNDILSSTVHTVSFTLDHKLFANQDGTQNV